MVNELFDIEQKKREARLIDGLMYADRFINQQYMVQLDKHAVIPPPQEALTMDGMRFYRMKKLVLNPEEDLNEKLISVYGALNSLQATIILIIRATNNHKIEFYLGTRCDSDNDAAGAILQHAINGNFTGSDFTSLEKAEIERLLFSIGKTHDGMRANVAAVTIVPSERGERNTGFVQGLEKLIDSMIGMRYTALFIAQPLSKDMVEEKKRGLEELYSTISPHAEVTLTYGSSAGKTVGENMFSSFSNSINHSVTNSNSESESYQSSSTTSFNSTASFFGDGGSYSAGSGSSFGESYGTSSSWSHAVMSGETETSAEGRGKSFSESINESRNISIRHTNKTITEMLDLIDRKLQRIRDCESFGLWSCSAYFISNRVEEVVTAASNFRSLMAGDNTSVDNSYINIWRAQSLNNNQTPNPNKNELTILQPLRYGMHPIIELPRAGQYQQQNVKPIALLSGKELPMFLSLPRTSVPGLVIDYVASFGRDVYNVDSDVSDDATISLGKVVHMGEPTDNEVELSLQEFRSHCFITGSTGSGKSNTTYHLLDQMIQNQIPFLVIEPAKGEYKLAFGGLKGIHIFWTNPYTYQLLRLNPFRFPKEIHVLEHIDRLIEIFSACWPLYSAMPAILKNAIERSYEVCGWDLMRSIHFDTQHGIFPTFSTLKSQLERVIGESKYSNDTKNDYIGALVTRVSSLTTGIMGSVLCNPDDIEDEVLFDQNTIVDLSRVGSTETKALIMGVLVMRLSEYRMSCGEGMNRELGHVTILEEAHNLLRRTSVDQSQDSANVAGKSVEMISNAIAEMRTYGEGFIIVDQSPTAVDISAIKNTNTKIVMRLPERSDFETVGSTFALAEDQLREISRLGRGRAIVSQSGWIEPVMVAIDQFTEKKYALTAMLPKNDDLASILEKWLLEAISQVRSGKFSQEALDQITEGRRLRKDSILQLKQAYKRTIQRMDNQRMSKRAVIQHLIVESIGCIQIAELCIPHDDVQTLNERNWITMRDKWYQTAITMIPQYITLTGSELTVKDIAWAILNCAIEENRRPWFTKLNALFQKYELAQKAVEGKS